MDMKSPEQREADKKLHAILDAVGQLNTALSAAGIEGCITEIRLPKKGVDQLNRTLEIFLTNGIGQRPTGGVTILDNVRFTVQSDLGALGRIADA